MEPVWRGLYNAGSQEFIWPSAFVLVVFIGSQDQSRAELDQCTALVRAGVTVRKAEEVAKHSVEIGVNSRLRPPVFYVSA